MDAVPLFANLGVARIRDSLVPPVSSRESSFLAIRASPIPVKGKKGNQFSRYQLSLARTDGIRICTRLDYDGSPSAIRRILPRRMLPAALSSEQVTYSELDHVDLLIQFDRAVIDTRECQTFFAEVQIVIL